MEIAWVLGLLLLVAVLLIESNGDDSNPLLVPLTLIPSAAAKGAVCIDGTVPGYHLHRGFGTGANNWLVNLEGGGWCNDIRTCNIRKNTSLGSSNYMEKEIEFNGILSDKSKENPDFFNWNRVKIRYCDGASFIGESYDKGSDSYFRGQRIWSVAMEDLMANGMHDANQALLSGCSAGGLAAIHHCDEFRALFPGSTKVKCLADAGLFLDAVNVAGVRSLRSFYGDTVNLQGVAQNLPKTCTSREDATSCFFPENVIPNIQTPTFLLNTAYDVWQIQYSLAPGAADPQGIWQGCKFNCSKCTEDQIQFLQGFRNQMLNAVKGFSASTNNGVFINSCFAHCQTEGQDMWFGDNSPRIGSKPISESVGNWYFDRSEVKMIDCPYPCDDTCHNLVGHDWI